MVNRSTRRVFAGSLGAFNLGVSVLAMALAAQAAAAQTTPQDDAGVPASERKSPKPANKAPPAKPATAGSSGTFSGTADVEAGTAQSAPGSASNTTGTSGTAQEAEAPPPNTDGNDIIVTGVRQSLANAQNIKRNSDTVVDAISADDIGSLPDRSVNEALQRVPGVAISRFAAPNDSQHFSVEGSGVTIRGLSYVRGEFNGRDTFAANAGREIGFNDVPTELVGSIEVFKNLTADLIEGGISGTANINTRKPFDTKDTLVYLSGAVNYGDFEKRSAPAVVGLFSKQWDLPDGGRVGFLASGSYNQQYNRSDSIFTSSFLPRFNAPDDGRDGYAPSDPTSANFDAGTRDGIDYQGTLFDGNLCDGNNPNEGRTINAGQPYAIKVCDAFVTPAGVDTVYTPTGAGFRTQNFDRKRTGISAAAQYESADRRFLLTAQYLRADATEEWVEHTTEPNVYYNDIGNTFPAGSINQAGFPFNPSNSYTFDENGVFTSGTIVRKGQALAHNTVASCTIPNGGFPYQSNYCPYPNLVNPGGIFTTFSNRFFYTKSVTQDFSANAKWEPVDRLHLNFDGQYVKSHAENVDDIVDTATFSDVSIDLRGKVPQVQFVTPGFDTATYFADPNNIYYRDAFNNRAINDGHEFAFRGDAQYDFSDDSFLRKVRVGGRYADRQQTVRTNDYNNWGGFSDTWTDHGPSYLGGTPNAIENFNYQNFFRGQTAGPPISPFIGNAIITDHDALEALLRGGRDTSNCGQYQPSYRPLEDRNKPDACGNAAQFSGDLIDGYFLPGEIYKNSEKTIAGYIRADFATHEFAGGIKLSGNIGVRYVHTTDASVGAITLPQRSSVLPTGYNDFATYCATLQANAAAGAAQNPGAPPPTFPALCQPGTTAAQQQAALSFATGESIPQTASQKFGNWLPSVNLRLDITSNLLMRFAASKAISRPNFGDLRNFLSIGYDGQTGAFNARSSNPYLKPIRSNQFDLTAEWYFAKVGSLTIAAFYKTLDDIILGNTGFTRDFANGGSSYTLSLTGPANATGRGKIKGLEFGYQQTYDFLPGPLRGLGLQATYTFLKPSSIPNSPPDFRPSVGLKGDGNQPPLDITGLYDNLPLAGLSKHTVNVSAFYDLAGFYGRVAYNWRSKFLLTDRDCCFPFLPVYSLATGTLDASAFYTVTKHFKIGFEAQNLLDTTTKTTFLLNGDGTEAPRSYFKSDRTYTITTRLTF